MATETVVFQVGNSLAVRLIGDCKLPRGMRIRERREGTSIILEPMTDAWLLGVPGGGLGLKADLPRPGRDEPARDLFA